MGGLWFPPSQAPLSGQGTGRESVFPGVHRRALPSASAPDVARLPPPSPLPSQQGT